MEGPKSDQLDETPIPGHSNGYLSHAITDKTQPSAFHSDISDAALSNSTRLSGPLVEDIIPLVPMVSVEKFGEDSTGDFNADCKKGSVKKEQSTKRIKSILKKPLNSTVYPTNDQLLKTDVDTASAKEPVVSENEDAKISNPTQKRPSTGRIIGKTTVYPLHSETLPLNTSVGSNVVDAAMDSKPPLTMKKTDKLEQASSFTTSQVSNPPVQNQEPQMTLPDQQMQPIQKKSFSSITEQNSIPTSFYSTSIQPSLTTAKTNVHQYPTLIPAASLSLEQRLPVSQVSTTPNQTRYLPPLMQTVKQIPCSKSTQLTTLNQTTSPSIHPSSLNQVISSVPPQPSQVVPSQPIQCTSLNHGAPSLSIQSPSFNQMPSPQSTQPSNSNQQASPLLHIRSNQSAPTQSMQPTNLNQAFLSMPALQRNLNQPISSPPNLTQTTSSQPANLNEGVSLPPMQPTNLNQVTSSQLPQPSNFNTIVSSPAMQPTHLNQVTASQQTQPTNLNTTAPIPPMQPLNLNQPILQQSLQQCKHAVSSQSTKASVLQPTNVNVPSRVMQSTNLYQAPGLPVIQPMIMNHSATTNFKQPVSLPLIPTPSLNQSPIQMLNLNPSISPPKMSLQKPLESMVSQSVHPSNWKSSSPVYTTNADQQALPPVLQPSQYHSASSPAIQATNLNQPAPTLKFETIPMKQSDLSFVSPSNMSGCPQRVAMNQSGEDYQSNSNLPPNVREPFNRADIDHQNQFTVSLPAKLPTSQASPGNLEHVRSDQATLRFSVPIQKSVDPQMALQERKLQANEALRLQHHSAQILANLSTRHQVDQGTQSNFDNFTAQQKQESQRFRIPQILNSVTTSAILPSPQRTNNAQSTHQASSTIDAANEIEVRPQNNKESEFNQRMPKSNQTSKKEAVQGAELITPPNDQMDATSQFPSQMFFTANRPTVMLIKEADTQTDSIDESPEKSKKTSPQGTQTSNSEFDLERSTVECQTNENSQSSLKRDMGITACASEENVLDLLRIQVPIEEGFEDEMTQELNIEERKRSRDDKNGREGGTEESRGTNLPSEDIRIVKDAHSQVGPQRGILSMDSVSSQTTGSLPANNVTIQTQPTETQGTNVLRLESPFLQDQRYGIHQYQQNQNIQTSIQQQQQTAASSNLCRSMQRTIEDSIQPQAQVQIQEQQEEPPKPPWVTQQFARPLENHSPPFSSPTQLLLSPQRQVLPTPTQPDQVQLDSHQMPHTVNKRMAEAALDHSQQSIQHFQQLSPGLVQCSPLATPLQHPQQHNTQNTWQQDFSAPYDNRQHQNFQEQTPSASFSSQWKISSLPSNELMPQTGQSCIQQQQALSQLENETLHHPVQSVPQVLHEPLNRFSGNEAMKQMAPRFHQPQEQLLTKPSDQETVQLSKEQNECRQIPQGHQPGVQVQNSGNEIPQQPVQHISSMIHQQQGQLQQFPRNGSLQEQQLYQPPRNETMQQPMEQLPAMFHQQQEPPKQTSGNETVQQLTQQMPSLVQQSPLPQQPGNEISQQPMPSTFHQQLSLVSAVVQQQPMQQQTPSTFQQPMHQIPSSGQTQLPQVSHQYYQVAAHPEQLQGIKTEKEQQQSPEQLQQPSNSLNVLQRIPTEPGRAPPLMESEQGQLQQPENFGQQSSQPPGVNEVTNHEYQTLISANQRPGTQLPQMSTTRLKTSNMVPFEASSGTILNDTVTSQKVHKSVTEPQSLVSPGTQKMPKERSLLTLGELPVSKDQSVLSVPLHISEIEQLKAAAATHKEAVPLEKEPGKDPLALKG